MNRSREHAERLLQKARDDQYAMSSLARDPQAPSWTIGFHAQQAVEKAIKAVLSAMAVEYPLAHDLERLLELVSAAGKSLPPDARDLPCLTPFGALLRYEDASLPESSSASLDQTWAVAAVGRTIQWAEGSLVLDADVG